MCRARVTSTSLGAMLKTVSPIAREEVGVVEADSAIVEVWTYLRAIGISEIISIGSRLVHQIILQ
jgi:hypothetical protein